ncbi:MAG: hypothetical protein AAGD38_19525 [Acidobacteriota bacterium]
MSREDTVLPYEPSDRAVTTGDESLSYEPPKVLSIEPLELAAATCAPATGGFGKVGPPTCGTLGS